MQYVIVEDNGDSCWLVWGPDDLDNVKDVLVGISWGANDVSRNSAVINEEYTSVTITKFDGNVIKYYLDEASEWIDDEDLD